MWRSKMQRTTALSTAEAEYYYSASSAGSDVLYLSKLLHQLGFAQHCPTPVYEDNTECQCIELGISIIGGRKRAKHMIRRVQDIFGRMISGAIQQDDTNL